MWRLKIADGGSDPHIFSTNNFTGRQIWEFDPEAGSPEERAEVEAARLNFCKRRHLVKASGDLLWRMQVYICGKLYIGISNDLLNYFFMPKRCGNWQW